MPHTKSLLAVVVALGLGATAAFAAPAVELADGGATIVYRAQAGDTASAIAAALGVAPDQIGRFLGDNGVKDAGRIPLGFPFRVPNPATARATAAEARAAAAEAERGTLAQRLRAAERALVVAREGVTFVEADRARLAALETRWSVALWALVVGGLLLAGSLAVTVAALGRERRASAWARSLALDLDDKRRAALAERQQSARRIVELEDRLRHPDLRGSTRVVLDESA
ncbi:MAG: LysM peptidoglycan-binding domain-containing protein [bacterium]|nr:LysM peptidoglycan-binding domain-containing protein [bacterium]